MIGKSEPVGDWWAGAFRLAGWRSLERPEMFATLRSRSGAPVLKDFHIPLPDPSEKGIKGALHAFLSRVGDAAHRKSSVTSHEALEVLTWLDGQGWALEPSPGEEGAGSECDLGPVVAPGKGFDGDAWDLHFTDPFDAVEEGWAAAFDQRSAP